MDSCLGVWLLFGDAYGCGGKLDSPVGGREPLRPGPGCHSALLVAPVDGPPQPAGIHRRKQMGSCCCHPLGHSSHLFPLPPQGAYYRPRNDSPGVHPHTRRPPEAELRTVHAAQAASCKALFDVRTVCACDGPPLHVAQHVCGMAQQKGVYPVPDLDALSHCLCCWRLCSPRVPLVRPPDLPLHRGSCLAQGHGLPHPPRTDPLCGDPLPPHRDRHPPPRRTRPPYPPLHPALKRHQRDDSARGMGNRPGHLLPSLWPVLSHHPSPLRITPRHVRHVTSPIPI